MESNLIGAVVITSNTKSDFTHYDDETEDDQVKGMIVERIDDINSSTSYLVMDEDGKIYQTDSNDIDEIVSLNGNPSTYLKREREFKL